MARFGATVAPDVPQNQFARVMMDGVLPDFVLHEIQRFVLRAVFDVLDELLLERTSVGNDLRLGQADLLSLFLTICLPRVWMN